MPRGVVGDAIFIDEESDAEDMSTTKSEYEEAEVNYINIAQHNPEDAEDEIRKRTPDQDLTEKAEETQETDDDTLEDLLRATEEKKKPRPRQGMSKKPKKPRPPQDRSDREFL